jgi:hypothetical protein
MQLLCIQSGVELNISLCLMCLCKLAVVHKLTLERLPRIEGMVEFARGKHRISNPWVRIKKSAANA